MQVFSLLTLSSDDFVSIVSIALKNPLFVMAKMASLFGKSGFANTNNGLGTSHIIHPFAIGV
jgi:hypothetical protein